MQTSSMSRLFVVLGLVLGVLASYLTHAILELGYLRFADRLGWTVLWTQHWGRGSCALPEWLQYGLVGLGVVGGLFFGLHAARTRTPGWKV